jgi:hypothetical protein
MSTMKHKRLKLLMQDPSSTWDYLDLAMVTLVAIKSKTWINRWNFFCNPMGNIFRFFCAIICMY